jgi:hypothetical protein
MALTTVEYSSYFHYDETIKQIKFTDSTDYVSQGTVAANVTVVAKVESPSGIFYNNTDHLNPDIDPGTSLDSLITIPLPLAGDGLPEQGLYTITLTYQDLVVPANVVDVKTFTLDYSSPTVDIDMTADCVTPLLSAIDNSSYTVNSVAPTVVRDFKIHYPPSTPTADVTGTASPLTTRVFYTVADSTVEHSSSLTSTLTYLFGADDLIYVIDEVTGSDVIQVACNGDICDIYCCIRSQWSRYNEAKSTDSVLAQKEYAKFEKVVALASLVGNAVRCGKNDHISDYVSEILLIANCDAGCSCNDGTPQLVTGLAVNGNNVVIVGGTGIEAPSVDGGGTTTYTVALSTENINKLAATYNRALTAGTNVTSITEVSSTSGDVTTKTSTINVDSMYNEELLVRVLVTMNSAAVPTISITNQKEYGSTFATVNQTGGTEFLLNNNNGSFGDWSSLHTDFTVGNFFSSSKDYYPEVKIVNIVKATGTVSNYTNNIDVAITTMSASEFGLRFSDKDGAPINGLTIQDYTSFELIFKINA